MLERAEGRDDWETYRHTRQSMAYDKRFSVLPKDTFLTLCDYLSETDQ